MSMARVKSRTALEHSIDSLRVGGYLRLWTFTLPVVLSIPDACERWRLLLHELVSQVGFDGIRVYELHENHGLHVHVVVNKFYSVDRLRFIAGVCGWGRTNVKRTNKNPYYVAKYVSTNQREGAFSHRRLWASFGTSSRLTCSKCRDIQVDSALGDAFKAVELEPWLIARRLKGGCLRGSDYSRYIKNAFGNFSVWCAGGEVGPGLTGRASPPATPNLVYKETMI